MSDPVSLLGAAYRDLSAVLSSLTRRGGLRADRLRRLDGGGPGLPPAVGRPPGPGRAEHPGRRAGRHRPPSTTGRPGGRPRPGTTRSCGARGSPRASTAACAGVAARYAETSAAVLVAAGAGAAAPTSSPPRGGSLTVADLLSTLTVEAAVHHLDLVLRLDRPGPAAEPLAEVRRVLEGLLGRPLPAGLGRRAPPPAAAPGGSR